MKYMLDTNIIIYLRKQHPDKVLKRFRRHASRNLCISSITLAELEYGVAKSSNPARNKAALVLLLSQIAVLPFDDDAACEYGVIRATLEKQGCVIGAYDMQIAAHAKSRKLTLVTHNTGEFSRIKGLKVVDWAL